MATKEVCSSYDPDHERCLGTRECDPCSCGGDPLQCTFYPYKRVRAKKEPMIQVPVARANWYFIRVEIDLGVRYEQVSILLSSTEEALQDGSLYSKRLYQVLDAKYHIEDYRVLDIMRLDEDQMYITQVFSTKEPIYNKVVLN